MAIQIMQFALWTTALLWFSVVVAGNQKRLCEDSSRVNIKGNSDLRKVSLGSSLTLFCCIGAQRPSELVWILPDGSRAPNFLKANGGNIFTFPDDSGSRTSRRMYLFFRNITIRQLGSYTCENARDPSSKSASVNIQQLDHIEINAPSVQWVRLGSPGQLVCNARGHPNLKISWYYRGMPVSTESTSTTLQGRYRPAFSLKKGGRILSIQPSVEWGHGGQYMCKAEVATDTSGDLIKVKPITLSIYKSPEVRELTAQTELMDKTGRPLAVEGKEIRISCEVGSYPDARIHWLKDNRPLRRADKRYKVTEQHIQKYAMVSTLAVRRFRESDIGTYTCVARLIIQRSNITEISQKSLTLDAILRPRFTRNQNLNITEVEKSRVDMRCQAFGSSSPYMRMEFFHNGRRVYQDPNKHRFLRVIEAGPEKLMTLVLTFSKLSSEDAGDYKCVVSTNAGFAEQNGFLVVNFPPKISNNTKEVYGWRNHRTKLVCIAQGTPAPNWRWLLNGRPVNVDGFVIRQEEYLNGVSSSSTLFVQPTFNNDRVFGQYMCVARNVFGAVNATSTLLRARRPGLPDITISEAHATSIRLQLAPPRKSGGAPLSHFQLRYKVYKDASKTGGHFFGPYDVALDRDLNIRGMMPHATYEFHIAAVSLLGAGLEQVVNFTTGAIGNPQPVQIVSDFYSSAPTIHFLKWKPNGNGGFPIREYRIKLRPVRVNPKKPGTDIWPLGDWSEFNVFNALSYKLENLRPNTYYQVKVQARTAFGASEKSHIFQTGSGPSALKSFYNKAGRPSVAASLVAVVMVWSAHYQLGLRIDA